MSAGLWWGNLKKRDYLEKLGVDGRMLLKWIFKMWDGEAWTGLTWHGLGRGGGLF
jgi:hypothetical protein